MTRQEIKHWGWDGHAALQTSRSTLDVDITSRWKGGGSAPRSCCPASTSALIPTLWHYLSPKTQKAPKFPSPSSDSKSSYSPLQTLPEQARFCRCHRLPTVRLSQNTPIANVHSSSSDLRHQCGEDSLPRPRADPWKEPPPPRPAYRRGDWRRCCSLQGAGREPRASCPPVQFHLCQGGYGVGVVPHVTCPGYPRPGDEGFGPPGRRDPFQPRTITP